MHVAATSVSQPPDLGSGLAPASGTNESDLRLSRLRLCLYDDVVPEDSVSSAR
jgi:hypothetical protein